MPGGTLITPDNVVFYVGEHQRRLDSVESHTEDIGVMRRDITILAADMGRLRNEVASLRKTIITSAVSFAASALFAACTIFLALR